MENRIIMIAQRIECLGNDYPVLSWACDKLSTLMLKFASYTSV